MRTLTRRAISAVSMGLVLTGPILAAPAPYTLESYTGPEITDELKDDQRACLAIGDAISCSAGMLNVLTGRDATNQSDSTNPDHWGYVVASPQGDLKDRIIVGTGGNAATDNDDIIPTDPAEVEDGFKSNNAGDEYAATGKTLDEAGNLLDPDPNDLNPNWDRVGTWDVSIDWLIKALTIDDVRQELMILFDYNQQLSAAGSLNYWALISVLDYEGDSATILREKTYEITGVTLTDPAYAGMTNFETVDAFTSTKDKNSKPAGTDGATTLGDFGTVNTKTCYLYAADGVTVIDVQPITAGQCSQFGDDYETVYNATGDSSTEIIAFLPELNAMLEKFLADGFDTISVRMLFGCFNDTDEDPKTGAGYLSSGYTDQCDGGGNVDVYLMANVPNDRPPVPAPGTLLLAGAGLTGLAWSKRRRRAARA